MSIMAATLANGGLNPWSEKTVCSAENVRCVLPVMLASGMYDYSGQWAYEVGMAAKSGVGGCVFMVVPNVCGIAVWSPRLDAQGNSVRGVAVASELVKKLQLHGFEVFSGSTGKLDPKKRSNDAQDRNLTDLLFAASAGDVGNLQKHQQSGTDLFEGDYDARTAMHLAASEGHAQCLQFLVDCMPEHLRAELISKEDRWHGTPLDEAETHNHHACAKIIQAAGGRKGRRPVVVPEELPPAALRHATPSDDAAEIIHAASRGELMHLITLNARGIDLAFDHHDYDLRTPLHLAASNGHEACVKYLVLQAKKANKTQGILSAVDRFGNTALADAVRENHKACESFIRSYDRREIVESDC
jgi:glutaminase